MPLITPRGQWKNVQVPGEFAANDENFAFLCGFEEISTDAIGNDLKGKSAKLKKKKKSKVKESRDLPASDDSDVEIRQEKAKKVGYIRWKVLFVCVLKFSLYWLLYFIHIGIILRAEILYR